jgi:hypothetical protein
MINLLPGGRSANDPPDDAVRTVEGWILGQAPLDSLDDQQFRLTPELAIDAV